MPPDPKSLPHTAAIGLGSNLGDRSRHLAAAIEALHRADGVRVVSSSEPIETPPLGPPGQQPYLNSACILRTSRSPRALLRLLRRIEASRGRDRVNAQRWGPRTLDLDLLLYDERVIDEPGLTIPHPRLHERAFVLEPLAAIAPDMHLPTLGMTVSAATHLLLSAPDASPEDASA